MERRAIHGLTRVAVLALMGLAPVLSAQAAPKFFTCEVIMGGTADDGSFMIRLTDIGNGSNPAFERKWFVGRQQISKEMLAIALTAMSNNIPVRLRTDPDAGAMPLVLNLYLRPGEP